MIILAVLLTCFCLYKIKIRAQDSDYTSLSQTTSIKGIFAVIIFISHIKQYIGMVFPVDGAVITIISYIGQLMVACFFWYSGFGIIQSLSKKSDYAQVFFKNRFFKVLLHFNIALFLYFLLSVVIGKQYSLGTYLLAWCGWTSLGNSNWFVFVMLCLYCITGIAFWIQSKWKGVCRTKPVALLTTVMSVLLWVALRVCGRPTYWYNTLLCFPAGMWFAVFQTQLDQRLRRNLLGYALSVAGTAVAFAVLYLSGNVVAYSVAACAFCMLITLVTMRVKVENSILLWLGRYSFEIYIVQRLPMIAMSELALVDNKLLYLAVAAVATLCLAVCLKKLYTVLDGKVLTWNLSKKAKGVEPENSVYLEK